MKNSSNEINSDDIDSHNYGQVLDKYITDIKQHEKDVQEAQEIERAEQWHRHSPFDVIYPWHMRLGNYESKGFAETVDESADPESQ